MNLKHDGERSKRIFFGFVRTVLFGCVIVYGRGRLRGRLLLLLGRRRQRCSCRGSFDGGGGGGRLEEVVVVAADGMA